MKLIEHPKTLAEHIVNAVCEDLYGRSGGDHFFDTVDEEVATEELIPGLVAAVNKELMKQERVFQATVYAYEGANLPEFADLWDHGMVQRALKFRASEQSEAETLKALVEAHEEELADLQVAYQKALRAPSIGDEPPKEPPLLQCIDCKNTESCAGAMARAFNHGRCLHCGGYFKVVRA